MEVISKCVICGYEGFSEYLQCKDHFLSGELFTIMKCGTCGFIFTSPRPKKEDLHKYYKSVEYVSHSATKKGIVNRIYHLVKQHTISSKIKMIRQYNNGKNILDIGCGSGEFLFECKKRGWNVTGIEPDKDTRLRAEQNYKIRVFPEEGMVNLDKSGFDVITLWHVLEHVSDLQVRMLEIKELLTDDGILVVALPNCQSYDAKKYGEFWAAYDVPRHLYHFNRKTINDLMQNFSFRIIQTHPMIFDAYYVSLLSEKYKNNKHRYISAILNGWKSNQKARMHNKEYSSLIYICKKV